MTDVPTLADALWSALEKTTISGAKYKAQGEPSTGYWGQAKGLRDQLKAATPPPSPTGLIPGIRMDRFNNFGTVTNKDKYAIVNVGSAIDDPTFKTLPGLRGFYKDLRAVRPAGDSAIPYQEAVDNGWLCHLQSNPAALYVRTDGAYELDISNPAVQVRQLQWLKDAYLSTRPWLNAILIDNGHPGTIYHAGGGDFYPHETPNYTAWRNAFGTHYKYVLGGLKAYGLYVQLNISSHMWFLPGGPAFPGTDWGTSVGNPDADWWREIAPSIDMGNIEHVCCLNGLLRVGGNAPPPAEFENCLKWQLFVNSLGLDWSTGGWPAKEGGATALDGQGMIYERVCFLLQCTTGYGGVKMSGFENSGDAWGQLPPWTMDVGKPTGPYTQPLGADTAIHSRVYRRGFDLATVYLNANQYGVADQVVNGIVLPSPSARIVLRS